MKRNSQLKIIGASMGDCVHVAGVLNFLRLAGSLGYETEFLGAARSPEDLALSVREKRPDILAVGYRLNPESVTRLTERLKKALDLQGVHPKLIFGGTPPCAEKARDSGIFDAVFSGTEDLDEIIAYLKGETVDRTEEDYPGTLLGRISWKAPYPLLRHHFGLPSLEDTIRGIEKIADSKVLDVISLGPDQNAQENFFHPEDMDPDQDGAGGVPVRTPEDFLALYRASRRGNYPLMRCYSGTRDVLKFAQVLLNTINNAWAAIPLCWYNVLDGRGPRTVVESIRESQAAMAWHAERGIPVEVNESHHWSLRDAPDSVAVAAAYLAAYNAKKMGVRDYVGQFMFNTPPGTSAIMDLGKMLAKLELIESLADENFRVIRQVRAGLSSFPQDFGLAKGQLATSTLVSMALKPHIVHVVGFCEGDHAATAEDVIESCKIVRGVIRNCLEGMPDLTWDERVQERKVRLLEEARVLLDAISSLPQIVKDLSGPEIGDPLTSPEVLAFAIKVGLLDAPHLVGNPFASGKVETRVVGGACVAVDPVSKKTISEKERVDSILATIEKSELLVNVAE